MHGIIAIKSELPNHFNTNMISQSWVILTYLLKLFIDFFSTFLSCDVYKTSRLIAACIRCFYFSVHTLVKTSVHIIQWKGKQSTICNGVVLAALEFLCIPCKEETFWNKKWYGLWYVVFLAIGPSHNEWTRRRTIMKHCNFTLKSKVISPWKKMKLKNWRLCHCIGIFSGRTQFAKFSSFFFLKITQ